MYDLTMALLASFDGGTTAARISKRAVVRRLQDDRMNTKTIPLALEVGLEPEGRATRRG